MKQIVLLAMLAAGFSAQAQQVPQSQPAQSVDCAKFSEAVEHDLKMLGMGAAAGPKDLNSVLAATTAATNIQSNLILMQAAKCKLPNQPISPLYYMQAAFDCNAKEQYDAPDKAQACDTRKWVRKPQ